MPPPSNRLASTSALEAAAALLNHRRALGDEEDDDEEGGIVERRALHEGVALASGEGERLRTSLGTGVVSMLAVHAQGGMRAARAAERGPRRRRRRVTAPAQSNGGSRPRRRRARRSLPDPLRLAETRGLGHRIGGGGPEAAATRRDGAAAGRGRRVRAQGASRRRHTRLAHRAVCARARRIRHGAPRTTCRPLRR